MRILWVKAGGLVPPDSGGRIRSYNILRELARQHSITFFTFYAAQPDDQHSKLNQIFEKVTSIPLSLPKPKSASELLDYGLNLFSRDPYNITKYCRPRVKRVLRSLVENEHYDVILCDFLAAAGALPWEWPGPKVLFTHNVEAMIWRRHFEVAGNPLWKALSWREWKTMDRAEHIYLQRADHVLAVSEIDREVFLKFLEPSKLTVIPTGVDVDFFQPRPGEENPDSLVFTGAMDWLANEDGIFYFTKQVLPLIRAKIPQVTLCVVGRKPSHRLDALASKDKNIQLTGWVEDVRPYLARGAVCIVPLRIGGGTRLKIFEAMSMAKVVVSTSIGAEGLPIQPGENILLADEPSKFAEHVVSLLRDCVRRRQIGMTARKLVVENYSWSRVAEGFAVVLEGLAAQKVKSSS
jgi:polysaccharide biosynthesis protein PslH